MFLAMIFVMPKISESQIIRATGNPTEASTQLIFVYNQHDEDTDIQITNTNDTEGVWIHVQIFRNDDTDGDGLISDDIFCEERDFVDFLTPNDTHFYELEADMFPKNIGETAAAAGDLTTLTDIDDTSGFVIITPVVSESDFTAISFEHMIGNFSDSSLDVLANAMGRSAVDFTTGEVLSDSTPLDGVTTGLVVLQPQELFFDFAGPANVELIGVAFIDNYGPAGLLGYNVIPGGATWTSFIFDFKEDPTSCGSRPLDCYFNLGLEDNDFTQNNTDVLDGDLCPGIDLTFPDGMGDAFEEEYGWVRIFVSGQDPLENILGWFHTDRYEGGTWMNTNN